MAVTRRDVWGWTGSKWRQWTGCRCLVRWTGCRAMVRRDRRSWAWRRRRPPARPRSRPPRRRPRRRPRRARQPTQVQPATRLIFFLECSRSPCIQQTLNNYPHLKRCSSLNQSMPHGSVLRLKCFKATSASRVLDIASMHGRGSDRSNLLWSRTNGMRSVCF